MENLLPRPVKICRLCKHAKDAEVDFSSDCTKPDNRDVICKSCRVARVQAIRGERMNKLLEFEPDAGTNPLDILRGERLERYGCRVWLSDGEWVWRLGNMGKKIPYGRWMEKFEGKWERL